MLKLMLTAIVILSIDGYFFTRLPLFPKAVKNIQKSPMELRWYSVIIVYIFSIASLFYFIILSNKSVAEGAFLGMITYGIFDFSNHAIFKNYGLTLAVMDVLWGTVLFAITTFIVKALLPN